MGKRGRACVVVLGDLGRSPRMQYHALSLARQVMPLYILWRRLLTFYHSLCDINNLLQLPVSLVLVFSINSCLRLGG
ncbi:hypothetical protein V6Z12_A09G005700 [Gossypium hirsutum]